MDRHFLIFLKIEFKCGFRVRWNEFLGFGLDFFNGLFFLGFVDVGDGGDIAHICKHKAEIMIKSWEFELSFHFLCLFFPLEFFFLLSSLDSKIIFFGVGIELWNIE